MKINKLIPLEKNPFKGSGDDQIKKIAASIETFGKMMEIRKIVIDEAFTTHVEIGGLHIKTLINYEIRRRPY